MKKSGRSKVTGILFSVIPVFFLAFSSTGSAYVLIDELYYDHPGTDLGYEYVELYNTGTSAVNLDGWRIQWAGTDFTHAEYQITGNYWIEGGGYFLIGGSNVHGVFGVPPDIVHNFDPPFQNSGTETDGVRIINDLDPFTWSDTVLYGTPNSNNLPKDINGPPADDDECAPDVEEGQSLSRLASHIDSQNCRLDFQVLANPDPQSGVTGTPTPTPYPVYPIDPGAVLISEVIYNPDGGDTDSEWLELYNTLDEDVNLAGCTIQSGGTTFAHNVTITEGIIPANGYFFLYEGLVSPPAGPNKLQVNFDPQFQNGEDVADGIRLLDSFQVVVDTILYASDNNGSELPDDDDDPAPDNEVAPPVNAGWALGRCPSSGSDTNNSAIDFWPVAPADITKNGPNICVPPSVTPTPTDTPEATLTPTATPTCFIEAGAVVINELMPNPDGSDDGREWLEIVNLSDEAIDLSNFIVESSTGSNDAFEESFVLPDDAGSMTLNPGEYMLIAESGVDVSSVPGTTSIYQPMDSGGLNIDMQNGGSHSEGLRLRCPSGGMVVDTVIYSSPNSNDIQGDAGDPYGQSPAPEPESGKTLARLPDGSDTDVCQVDFQNVGPDKITMGFSNDQVLPATGLASLLVLLLSVTALLFFGTKKGH